MKKIFMSMMTLLIALALSSCGEGAKEARKAQQLSGAGATFPLPFYNVVFEEFSKVNGDVVAYGGIGSGGRTKAKRRRGWASRDQSMDALPHARDFCRSGRLHGNLFAESFRLG